MWHVSFVEGLVLMSSMPKREIRMPDKLWNDAEKAAQQLFPTDERGERSSLVRDAIADAVGDWLCSPYVAEHVTNVAYVNRFGDAFYSTKALLRFNTDCPRLPCLVDQKVEKQRDYEKEYQALGRDEDRSQWLRARWLFNFSALYSSEQDTTPITVDSDSVGLVQKSVELANEALEGGTVVREISAGLLDYSQWFNTEQRANRGDRAAFAIDIPMRSLELVAIVDADLYRHSDHLRQIPDLQLQIRNRESVAFGEGKMGEYLALSSSTLDKASVFVTGDRHSQAGLSAEAAMHLSSMRARLAEAAVWLAGQAAKRNASGYLLDSVMDLMYTPVRFLYFRLRWLRPRTGLQVCVRWEKPTRPPMRTYPLKGAC